MKQLFRYILFTTYHNYYYLVTTEIDLLLIYLCKCKNPSFVIPLPPKKSGLLWLHKLLYLILFYNLKSSLLPIYAQNINTYHLLNVSMGSNSLLSWIWIYIAFALKISFQSAVLDRFEIKNSQKSFSALIICRVKNEEVRLRWRRDHPYITSAKVLVGWVQKR